MELKVPYVRIGRKKRHNSNKTLVPSHLGERHCNLLLLYITSGRRILCLCLTNQIPPGAVSIIPIILPLDEIRRSEVTEKDVLFAQKLCVLVYLNTIGKLVAGLNLRKGVFVL